VTKIYDALARAGCLIGPEAQEVIAAAKLYERGEASDLLRAVRAYRAATEPPKYVAEHRPDCGLSIAKLNEKISTHFYGPDCRADCEAWVAMKNGGRA
jgi:hypothetical protein